MGYNMDSSLVTVTIINWKKCQAVWRSQKAKPLHLISSFREGHVLPPSAALETEDRVWSKALRLPLQDQQVCVLFSGLRGKITLVLHLSHPSGFGTSNRQ